MALSDNVVVFGNSIRQVGQSLATITEFLKQKHLNVKDDSCSIVPASTRLMRWSPVTVTPFSYPVLDEVKCLGCFIACTVTLEGAEEPCWVLYAGV